MLREFVVFVVVFVVEPRYSVPLICPALRRAVCSLTVDMGDP